MNTSSMNIDISTIGQQILIHHTKHPHLEKKSNLCNRLLNSSFLFIITNHFGVTRNFKL
ncbi:MAG: hypothetical protein PHI40_04215 [Caldisericia bacterium]|nr:hypothetical protein [Caldisericia bacterium]MDD4614600.1 hypothetical protein [Caldisericia bacterium]